MKEGGLEVGDGWGGREVTFYLYVVITNPETDDNNISNVH